ncbi:MAG TPA: hypothetical protein VMV46_17265 [Thermoanaerobaculia bacterium]|nr:hypothetical protein [Thermoanaerobaculia bacterium]
MLPNARPFRLLIAAALLCALTAVPAAANDWDLGLRTGLYTDIEEAFLGFEALTRVADTDFFFNPNVEWVFVDNGDLFTVSFDVHYDLDLDLDWVDFWLGAGPTVLFRDPDFGRSDDDFGLNLLAGVGLREGAVRPYAQFKVILADETEAVIAIGLRFF